MRHRISCQKLHRPVGLATKKRSCRLGILRITVGTSQLGLIDKIQPFGKDPKCPKAGGDKYMVLGVTSP